MPGRPPSQLSSEPVQLAPGDVLARKYRLVEPLGEGGMAVVWVAQNIALETRVAVKILRASLASDARLVARIRQEAKATAAIAHKNIVQVYDYGVTNWGAPFIVMELLRGETLADRMKAQGKLAPIEAAKILLRAMKGVTIAHAKGIVHRDLKPENIFLAIEDNGIERPKVLDFGVSFVARESGDDRLTRAGGIVGTPSYLPPEAIEGDNRGDVRGDVWALGVMLHEMISGELPFRGKSVHALLESIVHDVPPRLEGAVPGVDARLQEIIDRALAKEPDRRYPGVRELFDDLNGWLGQQDPRASNPLFATGQLAAAPALALPSDPLQDEDGPTLVGPSLDPNGHSSSSLLALSRSQQAPALSGDRASRPPGSERSRSASPGPAVTEATAPAGRGASRGLVAVAVLGVGVGVLGLLAAAQQRREAMSSVGVGSGASASPPVSAAVSPSGLAALVPPGPGASGGQASSAGPQPSPSPQALSAPSIDIAGLPEKALVRVNGERAMKLPWPVPRAAKVLVRVDAPGYAPWMQEVQVDGPKVLTFGGLPQSSRPQGGGALPGGEYKNVPY